MPYRAGRDLGDEFEIAKKIIINIPISPGCPLDVTRPRALY